MIRIVIWTNLNAQSVCTYQIWKSLILWCSTRSEDSIDYKFVIFGHLVLKIWIKPANRRSDSILKIDSNWTHKIWIIFVLLDSRFPKDSNGILFANFGLTEHFIMILQDSTQFEDIWICLKQNGPRGSFLLGDTGSDRSVMWSVGSKGDRADQIDPYPFG
jgi:hypothetical protein